MARHDPPRKQDGTFDDSPEERDRAINLRLTATEYDEVQEAARMSGRTVSDYIRARTLGHPVVSKTDQIVINDLNRIGGLQKAWYLRGLGHPEKTAEILALVQQTLREIADQIRSRRVDRSDIGGDQ